MSFHSKAGMLYCVQLGETEVVVELIRQGIREIGLRPLLSVDANTDWDGNEIYLTKAEQEQCKQWVIDNYGDELWT